MRCPYCVSEIDNAALACPRCARDLYLFKPLLEKIGQLEKTVADQAKSVAANAEQRIAALEAEIATIKAERADAVPVEVVVQNPAPPAVPAAQFGKGLLEALLPALALLVAAHWLLLFVYDVRPIFLRLATIFLPVPFGFLLGMRFPNEFRNSFIAAIALATAGVFSMLGVTASIDQVPLLPQDARDWRETLEYIVSITLAFATGVILGEHHARKQLAELKTNRVVLLLARAFVPNEEGKLGIEKAVKKLTKLSDVVMPTATGAASIYAGIKVFLGQLG